MTYNYTLLSLESRSNQFNLSGSGIWSEPITKDNSTFVTHTKLKTRMDCNRLARESFGMLKICKNLVLFELCSWKKNKKKKKEDEQT